MTELSVLRITSTCSEFPGTSSQLLLQSRAPTPSPSNETRWAEALHRLFLLLGYYPRSFSFLFSVFSWIDISFTSVILLKIQLCVCHIDSFLWNRWLWYIIIQPPWISRADAVLKNSGLGFRLDLAVSWSQATML